MTITPRTLRMLDVVSIVALIVAGAVAFWPPRVQVATSALPAQRVVAPPLSSNAADSSNDASTVVAANIMSASRKAPSSRYLSPDLQVEAAYTPPAAFARTPSSDTTAADSIGNADAVPTVYGIVNMNGTWHALLRLSTSDANPSLLQEGDKRGAYRVVNISADHVVVTGPAGQRTLRLSRSAQADSTGHKP